MPLGQKLPEDFQSAFVGGFGPGVVAQVLQHAAQVVDVVLPHLGWSGPKAASSIFKARS